MKIQFRGVTAAVSRSTRIKPEALSPPAGLSIRGTDACRCHSLIGNLKCRRRRLLRGRLPVSPASDDSRVRVRRGPSLESDSPSRRPGWRLARAGRHRRRVLADSRPGWRRDPDSSCLRHFRLTGRLIRVHTVTVRSQRWRRPQAGPEAWTGTRARFTSVSTFKFLTQSSDRRGSVAHDHDTDHLPRSPARAQELVQLQ